MFYWDQDLTAVDWFCGGGGFGSGIQDAGASIALAVNHDPRSIATYQANFPNAQVVCAKVEAVLLTSVIDTLLNAGSPECTFQSTTAGIAVKHQRQLRGSWTDHHDKPHVEQSRASMWQVYNAAEAKAEKNRPYHSQFFENVTDVAGHWGGYEDWTKKMKKLGYEFDAIFLNSMFFGVPQRRDRWFGVFWRQGAKRPNLDFRPEAFCEYCEDKVYAVQCWKNPAKKWGDYAYTNNGQYTYNCPRCARRVYPYYRPAATVIDYADRGIKIKDRKAYKLRPLKETTLARIQLGIDRFVKQEQIVPPSATDVPKIEGRPPFWISYYSNGKPYSIYEPFCTFSTDDRIALVFPPEDGGYDIHECSVRMLGPEEVRAGTGLDPNFQIVATSDREVVRQCGHMVPPPMGAWVARQVISAI